MKLSYVDVLGDGERHQIRAHIFTEHPISSYGQPVIELLNGALLDPTSWILMDYKVIKASKSERELLNQWLSAIPPLRI